MCISFSRRNRSNQPEEPFGNSNRYSSQSAPHSREQIDFQKAQSSAVSWGLSPYDTAGFHINWVGWGSWGAFLSLCAVNSRIQGFSVGSSDTSSSRMQRSQSMHDFVPSLTAPGPTPSFPMPPPWICRFHLESFPANRRVFVFHHPANWVWDTTRQ